MENEPQAVLFADVHLWQQPPAQNPEAVGERKARVEPIDRNPGRTPSGEKTRSRTTWRRRGGTWKRWRVRTARP